MKSNACLCHHCCLAFICSVFVYDLFKLPGMFSLNLMLHKYKVIHMPVPLWIAVGVIFNLGVLQTVLFWPFLGHYDPVSLLMLSAWGMYAGCAFHAPRQSQATHQRAVHSLQDQGPKCLLFSGLFPHLHWFVAGVVLFHCNLKWISTDC